jgi:hypothetical protein
VAGYTFILLGRFRNERKPFLINSKIIATIGMKKLNGQPSPVVRHVIANNEAGCLIVHLR